jgi:tRNA dimethylallyltransferase
MRTPGVHSIEKPQIIIIQGPTGVGKTKVALSLAETFPIEIINADSMQVYRFLDIGTSKPAPDQQQAVPHQVLSIINPDEDFSAAQFKERAREAIADITGRGLLPLIVGGTGLYIRALTRGLFSAPGKNEELRQELKKKAQQEGAESLFKLLQEKDPRSAQKIKPNDMVRIIRALEVLYLTGVPISEHQQIHGFLDAPYAVLKIGLTRSRKELYQRIEARVDHMLAAGLLREVQSVLDKGYASALKSLQSIGYKQMTAFIEGRVSWDEAVQQMKKETKRLAKRQLTWFRHDPEIDWVTLPEEAQAIPAMIKNFLKPKLN